MDTVWLWQTVLHKLLVRYDIDIGLPTIIKKMVRFINIAGSLYLQLQLKRTSDLHL